MSRGNDVTMVLALNRISAMFGIFFWNPLCYVIFGKMSSAVRSLPKIYRMNCEISWNFYKKGIKNACTDYWTWCRQICYFLDVLAINPKVSGDQSPGAAFYWEPWQKWVNIEAMSYIWLRFYSGTSYCLKFSTTPNSHVARENLPHLVAPRNLPEIW